MTRVQSVATLIAVTVAILVMGLVTSAAVSPQTSEFMEDSEDWCNEHEGELYNENALWGHGGLHCGLPNGTHVHMSEVIGSEH